MHIKEINAFLKENAEPEFRDFSASLIPCEGGKLLGVRLPILRRLAAQIAKGDWEDYFLKAPEVYTEHIMLKGFLLGHIKDIDVLLKYLKLYIPKINNWAVCDSPLCSLKLIRKHQERVWVFLQDYIEDKREFYARAAACLLMCFFVDDKYIDGTLLALSKIKAEGYYRQMGVAWAISVCYVKFPAKTEEFLKKRTLDVFTHNKAISKIRESFRVNKADKDRLQALKR
ncbi:DNA alkylation repair protein [Candidatus Proelusimicrobium volucris]|uniref:DNA alkylation repair protein n=1 Tax=Candidatus Proelusimicrobium volucris TaxID=3416225 RepID=UPI003D0C5ABF